MIFQPKPRVSRTFNAAVLTMANTYATGWTAGEDAPQSFAELKEYYERSKGHIKVWSGASENTIFGCPEFNWAFRAWHDAVHIRYDLPFTPEGEREVAAIQCQQLIEHYGQSDTTRFWCALIDSEINGQLEYASNNGGEFPIDQVDCVAVYMARKHGYELTLR